MNRNLPLIQRFNRFLVSRIRRVGKLELLGMVPIIIDISEYQGNIDVGKIVATTSMAIIKATEGDDYVDPNFSKYWKAFNAYPDYPKTAYHFWRAYADPKLAAQLFVNTVGDAGGPCMSLFDDIEDNSTYAAKFKGQPVLGQWAKETLDYIEDFSKFHPGIYTGKWYWDQWISTYGGFLKPRIPPTWTSLYELWVASYTLAANPTMPLGWADWLLWQYTSSGNIDGIPTRTDVSRASVSMPEVLSRLHYVKPNPVPNPRPIPQPLPHPIPLELNTMEYPVRYMRVRNGAWGNHPVQNNHANDGLAIFGIPDGSIVGVPDKRYWNPATDNSDLNFHDGGIAVVDLTRVPKGLKLPLPQAPGWPESAYYDPNSWFNIVNQFPYLPNANERYWMYEKDLIDDPTIEQTYGINRIVNTPNDVLRVHNAPSVTAQVVGTLADKALVKVMDTEIDDKGNVWALMEPNRWAALEYRDPNTQQLFKLLIRP